MALGCDSCKPAWMSKLIQTVQAQDCDVHPKNKISVKATVWSSENISCYSAVVYFSSLSSQLVSSDACRYTGVSGAHSCVQCSPVSLLCIAGIMFTVEYLSALCHWPRTSPLLQLLIWLFSYSPSKTSVVLKSAVCEWCTAQRLLRGSIRSTSKRRMRERALYTNHRLRL